MAASRTMILLDPDIDPHPASLSKAVKRETVPKSADMRLPSTRTLARFLSQAQSTVRLRGQVTVLLTTDAALRNLNKRFRGKNKPTDVLSFPVDADQPGAKELAGDLAISIPTARRQAAAQQHTLSTEIKVLVLHGLLHLAGYDHETDTGQMERRERKLRTALRLPGGLIERSAVSKQADARSSHAKSSLKARRL